MNIKLGVSCLPGKACSEIVKSSLQDDNFQIASAYVREGGLFDNCDIGSILKIPTFGVNATSNIENFVSASDIIIDFSHHELSEKILNEAAKQKKPVVLGTTGIKSMNFLLEASKETAVFYTPNFSFVANIANAFLAQISNIMKDFNVEIIDTHGKNKKDAPSGTAYMFARAIAAGKGIPQQDFSKHISGGFRSKRSDSEIGISSVRAGEMQSEHQVIFASDTESLTITHKAFSIKVYAIGALKAAKWILENEKSNGIYGVHDLYDFKSLLSSKSSA